MKWRRMVDRNTPDLILRAGGHVWAEEEAIVAIFILLETVKMGLQKRGYV